MLRLARSALLVAALAGCASSSVVVGALPSAAPTLAATAAPTPMPTPTTVPTPPARATPVPELVQGGDISWPSCPVGTQGALPKKQGKGLPLPGPAAQFVIIGLTNGPGFYANPCLAAQVQALRRLPSAAYAFTTLPTPAQIREYGGNGPYPTTTDLGRLRNAARAQALVNVASLKRTGLRTPIVWIDVEPQPYLSPWGTDVVANRAAILAVRQAYRAAGYLTGFYSSDTPWKQITGGMRSPDPVWVTVGPRGRAAALVKCEAPTFSGGPAVLAQWWDGPTEDLDLTCPTYRSQARRWFAPAR